MSIPGSVPEEAPDKRGSALDECGSAPDECGSALYGLTTALRIGIVAPVATSVPPPRSGSVALMTSLLTEGLVRRGHDVTLFATGDSTTAARLHATFPRGYRNDPLMWPWELCEMFNLAAAVERAAQFDVLHCQAEYYPMSLAFSRLAGVPVVHSIHHSPREPEVNLWSRYPEAPFVAVSNEQARRLAGLNVAGIVPHGFDPGDFPFQEVPEDYVLFVGRFTEGKGVLHAVDAARRAGVPLVLAAQENDYYRETIAPFVDGASVLYAGEADGVAKGKLYGGARALLYPVQEGEPFGLVMVESMLCGTPVAALDRGAVREIVDDGLTGFVFEDVDALVAGLGRVMDLDRRAVRRQALARFHADRMVEGYEAVYRRLLEQRRGA